MTNFEDPEATTNKSETTDDVPEAAAETQALDSRDASDLLPRLPRLNGNSGQVGSNASAISSIKVARFREAEKRLGGPIEPRHRPD